MTPAPVVGTREKVFDPLDFRNALGSFATGVTIVTSAVGGRLVGVTCNSFASLSLEPPLVLWSLADRSSSRGPFEDAGAFAVNVLSEAQEDLALRFARSGSDKFADTAFSRGLRDIPVLEGCLAVFQCRTVDCRAGGDHLIFIGSVEAYDYRAGAPLLFSRGRFRSFDEEL